MNILTKINTSLNVVRIFKNWPIYFLDYFGLIKNKNIIYKTRDNQRYMLRAGTFDRIVINEILLYKLYSHKGFELKDGYIILDIGAHIGLFSILASKYAKNGKIFGFEPSLENFNLLKENIKLNEAKNIIPINKAIANKSGKREFFISPDSDASHSFLDRTFKGKKVIIDTSSLKDFIRENKIKKIDFLKMDCECAEYEIIFKCPKEVLSKIQKIAMEYHNMDEEKNGYKLKSFLEINGFDVDIKSDCHMLFAKRVD